MKTILITGFEPFGGETVNPSWEAIKPLQGCQIAGASVEIAGYPAFLIILWNTFMLRLNELSPMLSLRQGKQEADLPSV